jgi:protein-S-isoprenylcysteine O-methyltransferase Ste14
MTIMNKFDPFGWLGQVVPVKWLHRIIRTGVLLVILIFLVMRIRQYDQFLFKPLWAAETLLYIIVAIAFAVRSDPVDRSRGVAEIIVPLIGSVLPFALLTKAPGAWILGKPFLLKVVFCWMAIAEGFTAWSIWSLRRSFSITVEARAVVTHGPYRWVRHPVYLGEILAAAAVVAWRWSLLNIAIFILFVIIQLLRARWEESKLRRTFPEYTTFSARSKWL